MEKKTTTVLADEPKVTTQNYNFDQFLREWTIRNGSKENSPRGVPTHISSAEFFGGYGESAGSSSRRFRAVSSGELISHVRLAEPVRPSPKSDDDESKDNPRPSDGLMSELTDQLEKELNFDSDEKTGEKASRVQNCVWSFSNKRYNDVGEEDWRASVSLDVEAAKYKHTAASTEPAYVWCGQMPARALTPTAQFSTKVFLGGIPHGMTGETLLTAFQCYGAEIVEWPDQNAQPRGYAYLIFPHETNVKHLLLGCRIDYSQGSRFYCKLGSRLWHSKEVEVIPWVKTDSYYFSSANVELDPNKTVFVGALHGMMNAKGLAMVMTELFGSVLNAKIDLDSHHYPSGTGRIVFATEVSYMKAIEAKSIEVKTPYFTKKIQVDPYLQDADCHICKVVKGPYFCRSAGCLNYFCQKCWNQFHITEVLKPHKPLKRFSRQTTADV